MSDFQWILAGFDRFSTPGVAVVGIHWDPSGSKKNCQKKEGISPGIFEKEGKINSDN